MDSSNNFVSNQRRFDDTFERTKPECDLTTTPIHSCELTSMHEIRIKEDAFIFFTNAFNNMMYLRWYTKVMKSFFIYKTMTKCVHCWQTSEVWYVLKRNYWSLKGAWYFPIFYNHNGVCCNESYRKSVALCSELCAGNLFLCTAFVWNSIKRVLRAGFLMAVHGVTEVINILSQLLF